MNNGWFDLGEGLLGVAGLFDGIFGLIGLGAEVFGMDFGSRGSGACFFVLDTASLSVDSSDVDVSLERFISCKACINKGWLGLGEDLHVAALRTGVCCSLFPGQRVLMLGLGVGSCGLDEVWPLCFMGASLVDDSSDVSLEQCTPHNACMNKG